MRILALEKDRPGASTSDFLPHRQAEARAVWDLLQAGIIREIFFRDDRPEAVMLLEAASAGEAQAALVQLPLVRAGLIEFEVIALRPYPGLSRLFAESVT